jgi:hypothetical protein
MTATPLGWFATWLLTRFAGTPGTRGLSEPERATRSVARDSSTEMHGGNRLPRLRRELEAAVGAATPVGPTLWDDAWPRVCDHVIRAPGGFKPC